MDVVVVYESAFGNTRVIAEAVADGLRGADPDARVAVLGVAEATPDRIGEAELVVVGGPTHMLGMSRASSRQKAMESGDGATRDKEHHEEGAGGAARSIARKLRRHGYDVVAKPEGFVVDGAEGPLRAGERDRANAWGAGLAPQAARRPGR
jgi:flavorubredoxin